MHHAGITAFSLNRTTLSLELAFSYHPDQFLDRVKCCAIGNQAISDHAPISVTVSPPYKDPSGINWCLNPSLLSSPPFVDYISKELQFLSENKSPVVSPTTLWEAAKAYPCGAIISYSFAQKKKALKTQLELEEKIRELEVEFKRSLSKSTGKQMLRILP